MFHQLIQVGKLFGLRISPKTTLRYSQDEIDGFEVKCSKKQHKKQRIHSQQLAAPAAAATTAASASSTAAAGGDNSGNRLISDALPQKPRSDVDKRKHVRKLLKEPLLIGMRTSLPAAGDGTVHVTGAKPFKAVYCIDNVSQTIDVQSLTAFVSGLGVRTISCYEVNPRMTRWQKEHNIEADHKTFRLCINKADNSRLLKANRWPADVTVSEWFFKKPSDK